MRRAIAIRRNLLRLNKPAVRARRRIWSTNPCYRRRPKTGRQRFGSQPALSLAGDRQDSPKWTIRYGWQAGSTRADRAMVTTGE
ncbi:hypothetical protein FRACA_430025 [Frankia canadensis]|uniref:Uncharacterized protein n=1 Tax=Frankia canadensis TaxID=1836972 RepID=A0A2I2KX94_9ACTN|nr:hypothetical protein FRACA_430025 [Frankia canadensis]SOU57572.1 hypothetical protein FRACA_430025 [Frankia canadensis]